MFTDFMENHSVPLETPTKSIQFISLTFQKQTNFIMFTKTLALFAFVAVAQAGSPGYVDSALALGAQSEHTFRGYGGLSSISKQAKAVDSAYSSVRKYDSRITNDATFAHPVGYAGYAAAPLAAHGYAAPAVAYGHAAPAGLAYGPHAAYAGPVAHAAYAGPVAHGYAAPLAARAYAAPYAAHGYAAPLAAHGYAAPIAKAVGVAHPALAYSPAAAVASHSFSGFGISYGY